MMSVETDKRLADYALDYLARLPYVHWLRALPDVMRGSDVDLASTGTGGAVS